MKTVIAMTSKGQLTLPVRIRQALDVNHKGAKLAIQYDAATGRYFLEKPLDLVALHDMNRNILARQKTALIDYKSGDGFRSHVSKRDKEA